MAAPRCDCGVCTACKQRAYVRKWRNSNPEKVREYQRRWVEKNREKVREHNRRWREENRDKMREYEQRWRDKNREKERERHRLDYLRNRAARLEQGAKKRAARPYEGRVTALVHRAVKKGVLVRGPCEQASDECVGTVEGHHDDYSKPLEVRWLCRRHHQRWHRDHG